VSSIKINNPDKGMGGVFAALLNETVAIGSDQDDVLLLFQTDGRIIEVYDPEDDETAVAIRSVRFHPC
jgi:hypothetical protein